MLNCTELTPKIDESNRLNKETEENYFVKKRIYTRTFLFIHKSQKIQTHLHPKKSINSILSKTMKHTKKGKKSLQILWNCC